MIENTRLQSNRTDQPLPAPVAGNDSSADDLWLVAQGAEVRAMTLDELDAAFRRGTIDASTMIRSDSMNGWVPLGVLANLDDDAPTPVPRPERRPAQTPAPESLDDDLLTSLDNEARLFARTTAPLAFSPELVESLRPRARQLWAFAQRWYVTLAGGFFLGALLSGSIRAEPALDSRTPVAASASARVAESTGSAAALAPEGDHPAAPTRQASARDESGAAAVDPGSRSAHEEPVPANDRRAQALAAHETLSDEASSSGDSRSKQARGARGSLQKRSATSSARRDAKSRRAKARRSHAAAPARVKGSPRRAASLTYDPLNPSLP
jgi:hypothetical protein